MSGMKKLLMFGGIGLVLLFGVSMCGVAMVAVGTSEDSEPTEVAEAEEPKQEKPRKQAKQAKQEEAAPEPEPVQVTAKSVEFQPSVLYAGGDFTSVQVTVVNNSEENVDINPLSFYLVKPDGTKVPTDALGEDERQIDTLTLSPGQKAQGTVTASGAFQPKEVVFETDMFTGDGYTVPVN